MRVLTFGDGRNMKSRVLHTPKHLYSNESYAKTNALLYTIKY